MSKNVKKIIAALSAAVVIGFCAADAVRAKLYKLPPLFCVSFGYDSDGRSRDYYGLGYKIWQDVQPFEDTVDYYISLWILPKNIHI